MWIMKYKEAIITVLFHMQNWCLSGLCELFDYSMLCTPRLMEHINGMR
jgi:hypothetical protein